MSPSKPRLRASLKQARLSLSPEERHAKSTAIAASLLEAVNWSQIRSLHCFEPIMRLGEVDLVDFVTALENGETDIRVYTSRKFDGQWQVVDTGTDRPAVVLSFDAVIVPMLGFNPDTLHRVGYGGGYYDRFLATQPATRKIGVCYELGRVEELPSEPHDIPLDLVITESQVYTP